MKNYSKLNIFIKKVDVSNLDEINAFFEQLPEDFPDGGNKIDILVNNAGKAQGLDKVGEINQQDIDSMFQTDVIGMIAVCKKVIPLMQAVNSGDIVPIGSGAGIFSLGGSIYCATKHSLRGFTNSLRQELISTDIRIIEVDPDSL